MVVLILMMEYINQVIFVMLQGERQQCIYMTNMINEKIQDSVDF